MLEAYTNHLKKYPVVTSQVGVSQWTIPTGKLPVTYPSYTWVDIPTCDVTRVTFETTCTG